ncbi:MAG: zinc ribbon domain-containing protein [Phycisphaeraceae bacterium]|nr:zinc ribbon domain-containing protein [Phycisphaeraceae bacterium]
MWLRRAFLWCVIASLAMIGIDNLLLVIADGHRVVHHLDDITFNTLPAVLCGLASVAAVAMLGRTSWRWVMIIAVALSVPASIFWNAVFWVPEVSYLLGWDLWRWSHFRLTFFHQVLFLITCWACALPQIGLLSAARLQPGFGTRLRAVAIGLALALPLLISWMLLAGPINRFMDRVLWFVGIADALGSLAVPVVSRIQKIEKEENVQSTTLELRLVCPRCLREQILPSGVGHCARCRLRIEVKIEEPRCPKCDYLLHHLTAPVCPECGCDLSPDEVPVASLDPATISWSSSAAHKES